MTEPDNVTPIRPLTKDEALSWLQANAPVDVKSYRSLAQRWGWDKQTAWRAVQAWRDEGRITIDTGSGQLVLRVSPGVSPTVSPPSVSTVSTDVTAVPDYVSDNREVTPMGWFGRSETAHSSQPYQYPYQPYPPLGYPPPPPPPPAANDATPSSGSRRLRNDVMQNFSRASEGEKFLLLLAFGLSGVAAYISVTSMQILFPGAGYEIVILGGLIEAVKAVGFCMLSAGRKAYSAFSRLLVALLLIIAACINAASVYSWLVSSHAGPGAERAATYQTRAADNAADLEVAAGKVQDLDARIRVLASIKRMDRGQRTEMDDLAAERDTARRALATLRASQRRLAAEQNAQEAAAAPVRYATLLAEDLGLVPPGTSPDRLMRILAGCLLLCGDPLAICVMFMINSRWRRR